MLTYIQQKINISKVHSHPKYKTISSVNHLLGTTQLPRLIERISNFYAIVDPRQTANATANHHRSTNL